MNSGSTLGWNGDSTDPINLAIGLGKLQTFCRNLEDKLEKYEGDEKDLIKLRVELDEIKGRISELRARVTSIEDLQEEVESAKKIIKMLNPKTIAVVIASVMGTSVGGGVVVDSMTNDNVVVEEKVDNQQQMYNSLIKKIEQLEDK
jgi:prefoldin subunit 5|tara:strand:- start:21105 stop:21542 length:438 start_codon:yes stop_codon:yes gene_type:complete